MPSKALFLLPKLPLYSCWVVLYSCCVVLYSCCLMLCRVVLVLCRVISCCTRVVSCCLVLLLVQFSRLDRCASVFVELIPGCSLTIWQFYSTIFQPIVALRIEISNLIYGANQMTSFFKKCNTGLKRVKLAFLAKLA